MTQNAGRNQGGVNKAADKSADRKRKATGRSARHRSEAGWAISDAPSFSSSFRRRTSSGWIVGGRPL